MTPMNSDFKRLTPTATMTTLTWPDVRRPQSYPDVKENEPDFGHSALNIKQRNGIERTGEMYSEKDWIARRLDSKKGLEKSSKTEAYCTFLPSQFDRSSFLTAMDSQKNQLIINSTNDSANWLRTIKIPETGVFFIFFEQILIHRSYSPIEMMNISPSALNLPNLPSSKWIDPIQLLDGLIKFGAIK